MKFLTYPQLKSEKGIPYSDRQLKRKEAKGLFPKRKALVKGGALKGWTEQSIDSFLKALDDETSTAK